jgi:hypothetical protein
MRYPALPFIPPTRIEDLTMTHTYRAAGMTCAVVAAIDEAGYDAVAA